MDTKTICLGALSLGDASGYEIKKMFEEGPFSHFYDAGYGSIYPALNSLLEQAYVTCEEMEQVGRPAKKVYSITETGRAALNKQLNTPPAKDRIRSECLAMMFFGDLLDPQQKKLAFQTYTEHFRERLQCLRDKDLSNVPPERRFVHGLGLLIYQTALDYMERGAGVFLDDETDEDGEADQTPRRRAVGGP